MDSLIRTLSVSLFTAALALSCRAATFTASELTPAAVQALVNAAADGDTILLPAGTSAPWTSRVTITAKSLTIRGAGRGVTIINDAAGPGSFTNCFRFASMGGKSFEMSDITFISDPNLRSDNILQIEQAVGFKIHSIEFKSLIRHGIFLGSQSGVAPAGVIYNCLFQAPFNLAAQAITLAGTDFARPPLFNANGKYASAPTFGTTDAVYIEDCIFDFAFPNDAAVELYNGGRMVLRNSTLLNCMPGVHGKDSSLRSGYTFEIYNNMMTSTLGSSGGLIQIRGGTGVIFNNTVNITGPGATLQNVVILDAYRATGTVIYSSIQNGFLDGSSPIDGNQPEINGTGTHNGPAGATVLTDTTKSWTVNEWNRGGDPATHNKPYHCWNRTTGASGWVVSNTSNSVTVTLTGGSRQTWEPGDVYVLTNGYPGLDQVGWSGPTTFAATHSTQVLTPVYQWNNSFNGTANAGLPFVVGHVTGPYAGVYPNALVFIKEGREYYNNVAKPGYTPLEYPHPLRGVAPPPGTPPPPPGTPPPPTVIAPSNARIDIKPN